MLTNIEYVIKMHIKLITSFEKSFINSNNEFIAHRHANDYFRLDDCKQLIDVECKVLEFLTRGATKGQPYAQEWRNKKYRKSMQDGINKFLGTNFTESQFEVIYQKLGNAVKHELTKDFINSGYDFTLLEVNND